MSVFVAVAHAQGTAERFVGKLVDNVLQPVVYLLIGLAVVFFLWGVVQFVSGADNADRVTEGRNHMIWGLIGLFIMVSVIGIMNLICNSIGAC